MESTSGSALRIIEPTTQVRYTGNRGEVESSFVSRRESLISTGISAYSPKEIGGDSSLLSSMTTSTSETSSVSQWGTHMLSSGYHLDLARTPHPHSRFRRNSEICGGRLVAGSDRVADSEQLVRPSLSPSPNNSRTISRTESITRYDDGTEVRDQIRRERHVNRGHKSRDRSKSSYTDSTASSRSRAKKYTPPSTHHSSSNCRTCSSESTSTDSKPSRSLPYHHRPSRRDRKSASKSGSTKSILKKSLNDVNKSKTSVKSPPVNREQSTSELPKIGDSDTMVFTLKKGQLIRLVKSLYDVTDDTLVAIHVKRSQMKTLAEYKASKEKRLQEPSTSNHDSATFIRRSQK